MAEAERGQVTPTRTGSNEDISSVLNEIPSGQHTTRWDKTNTDSAKKNTGNG